MVGKQKPKKPVVSKHKVRRAVLRAASGALKQTRKSTGFVRATVLTQTSNRLLQRIGEKRKGERQKQRERVLKNKSKIDAIREKHKHQEDQDDDDVNQETKKPNFFDISDELRLTPEDEKLLEQFKRVQPNNLASQFEQNLKQSKEEEYEKNYLSNPKILLVYGDLAELLKTYRSGKLPQPFHIIPTVAHWQDLLKLTRPHEWTPQAINAATKIFSSSMNVEKAEYFYKEIILPAVRASIAEDKKLNYHLYQALMKALYKPAAWFKGILFELCKQSDVTLKEAQIIGSIIHRQSIPTVHGSIVIFKLLQYPYNGPIAVLLKLMIEKKYSLPLRVVNDVVTYFLNFAEDEQIMPVIWHQTLLRFCEFYLPAFSQQQRKDLSALIKTKNHYLISPEIQKVLSGQAIPKKQKMDEEN